MSWRDKSVLVTGATGLVGGHLIGRLVEEGANVTGLVRDFVGDSIIFQEDLVGRISVVHGDILDEPLLERVLNENEIDYVFHLAAQTTVPVANRNPLSTWEANVRGTYNLLEAVRRSRPKARVVAASTDKAYGEQPVMPTCESSPLNAVYPYDVSKACADMICQSYAVTFGLQVAVTRCGNLFGEGDLNWNRLIPGAVRSTLRGEPVAIRSDGTLVRDYLYVGDAVDAYLSIARMQGAGPSGWAFNVTEEVAFSVTDMVGLVQDSMGAKRSWTVGKDPVQEIPAQHLSSARIRDVVGWTPKFGIKEGLRRTIEWYRELLCP